MHSRVFFSAAPHTKATKAAQRTASIPSYFPRVSNGCWGSFEDQAKSTTSLCISSSHASWMCAKGAATSFLEHWLCGTIRQAARDGSARPTRPRRVEVVRPVGRTDPCQSRRRHTCPARCPRPTMTCRSRPSQPKSSRRLPPPLPRHHGRSSEEASARSRKERMIKPKHAVSALGTDRWPSRRRRLRMRPGSPR
jgi:hypothetical protein